MSQTPIASTSVWRATDLEAIRVALSIPARLPAIRAINDAMADLEQLYPDAIPTARRELDAISAIDTELAGLGPEQMQAPIETRRKAVPADALPEDGTLPVRKADVIEYDTELLQEETITRYGEGLSIEQALRRQRGSHAQALLRSAPGGSCSRGSSSACGESPARRTHPASTPATSPTRATSLAGRCCR